MNQDWTNSKIKNASNCLLILGFFKLFFFIYLAMQMSDFKALWTTPELGLAASYGPMIWGALIWQAISVAFVGATAWALRKDLLWGVFAAALIAILNLPSLFFPLSFLTGWFLMPDAWREFAEKEIFPVLKKKVATQEASQHE